MSVDATAVATTLAAVATGLTAGVYLAFSVLVMPALAAAPPAPALAVMQRINLLAPRPVFGLVFAAAAIGSGWVLVAPWIAGQDRQPWPTVGAALSLTAFAVTAAANVPWNRRIANLDGSSPADLRSWQSISVRWRWANHLRGGCATLGLIAFLM
ncbi:anthrone oxygenase family protein [Nakamurella sp.]|uniref:anthrone oxygenase family protein n=1 Tax=Nakamurella sp. TaxID=1869182 RepID=UPI003784F21C